MNWTGRCKQWTRGCAMVAAVAALLSVGCGPSATQGTTLNGRWALPGEPLHNGTQTKSVFTLKQDGDNVTGTVRGLGYSVPVKGAIKGAHFELFGLDDPSTKPMIAGDVAGANLQGTMWGKPFTATPATPADDFPKVAYIEPPALHDVPANGLAKTPPMGWNSWNLFADKVDDKTVRTMADAMVSSGMRDAGYVYVNIDDTWQGNRGPDGVLPPQLKIP